MSKKVLFVGLLLAFSVASTWAAKTKDPVIDSSALIWKEAMPGVSIAAVQGNPDQGASHFFLKYAGGLKTPPHHHNPDHYVTVMSGTLTLTVDGVEHKLTPGSFFALTRKASHVAVCAEGADCVMAIDARGKWDVVPEKK